MNTVDADHPKKSSQFITDSKAIIATLSTLTPAILLAILVTNLAFLSCGQPVFLILAL